MRHKPVLLREALESLNLKTGSVVVDGTLGSGGHAQEILKSIGPNGRLIGLDQDPDAIDRCRAKFQSEVNVFLFQNNFSEIKEVLRSLNLHGIDAALLDVGISSDQLEEGMRGFSFDREGPLDMRMNYHLGPSAKDLVAQLPETELERIFREYGEERRARRFARGICEARKLRSVETTLELAELIEQLLPRGLRFKKGHRPHWARHHPATRVFQALRIAVNDELGSLKAGLHAFWEILNPGGRLTVISFHSLEDRIVKWQLRAWHKEEAANILYKKPVIPADEEMRANPRSRSAKMRTVEKKV